MMTQIHVGLLAAALGGVATAQSAMPERQHFPPMHTPMPLHESDLLAANSLDEWRLGGPVQSFSMLVMIHQGDDIVEWGPLEAELTRDGYYTEIRHFDSGAFEWRCRYTLSRSSTEDGGELVRLSGAQTGELYHGPDTPVEIHYVLDKNGDPVATRGYQDGEKVSSTVRRGDRVEYQELDDPPSPFVIGEEGRVIFIGRGPKMRLEWHGDRVRIIADVTDKHLLTMRLDQHGNPVDLSGPQGAPSLAIKADDVDGHSRRTFEYDEHANWTGMLVEYEIDGGWRTLVEYRREIEYWED